MEDADAFVAELTFSIAQAAVDFDLTLGLSQSRGVYLEGSGSLETAIATHVARGPFAIDALHLVLIPGQSALSFEVSISGAGRLGPIAVEVTRIGLLGHLHFAPGNLGPVGLTLGFKPPTGAGLGIDTAVTGIGLLTTRLPDGSKGFSLLVMISAEGFTPIQLGFGFTLNGIGGLLGVNRSVAVDVLQGGIKTGVLDSVLFPRDVLTNAPNIVSDLSKVFPPVRDRYVLSPMFILGWGTPSIVTAKIALVLALPALPGSSSWASSPLSSLPSEDLALVFIQVDLLGIIDFDRSTLSIDASLRESYLVAYTLTGDMAVRANWGAQPSFVLAVGGLHPRFSPPAGFPKLERLTVSLGAANNPRLRLESYLALTANSAQIGARLDFYVEAAGFSLQGALAFDVLFQFTPFQFVADIAGALTLKAGSTVLMSVGISLTLSGPSPWRVRGTAKFEVLFISVSVSFDKQFGPEERPPLPATVEVLPMLLAALRDKGNWAGLLPREGRPLVSLRGLEGEEIIIHPFADLTISQRVVPLGIEIAKFGNTKPRGERKFEINSVALAGKPALFQPVKDFFAAGQFLELSDNEKLSRPSFERMQSGIRLTMDKPTHDTIHRGVETTVDIEYETLIIDKKLDARTIVAPQKLPTGVLHVAASHGAAALARTRRSGRAKYRGRGLRIAVKEPGYVIADISDLSIAQISELTLPEGAPHTAAVQALRKYLASHPKERARFQVVARHEGVPA